LPLCCCWLPSVGERLIVAGEPVTIGRATLYLGDCLAIMPQLGTVSHVICDPPYEASLHASKNSLQTRLRSDSGPDLKGLDFDAIDEIREAVVGASYSISEGWFIAFCTVEGTWPWAQVINASPMKYKRACAWVKPDSTPQLNGQCPAQGYECFVTAWAGTGHSKWNAGGKRGVYTHCVNGPQRDGRHPTEKPLSLMAEIIADFTKAGDTILDPFMGSGTTGVAAIRARRNFVGIERDPKYFEIARSRLSAVVGEDPGPLFGEAA
jgi:site-specific DNA-methyltransferase (adenine-specific)